MQTLTLRTLDRFIRIDCEEPRTLTLVAATYGHMRDGHEGVDLHYTVGQGVGRDRATFFVERRDRGRVTAPDDGAFLALLDADLVIELQKLRPDLYVVHAAVLTVAGLAVMLVAKSGGGKSTVCWGLSHHGFRVLSDELGPVDLTTMEVHPYPRAVMLKTEPPRSYPVPPRTLHTSRGLHVAPENIPGGIGVGAAPLAAVCFLRYQPDARGPSVRRISGAEAAVRLYANTLNPLAHPGEGLDAAIRLTRAVTCFEFVTADLTATCGLLTATLATVLSRRRPIEEP